MLVSQGVVQNLRPYDKVTPLDSKEQVIAQGPVASQEIIKEFGTNGGGFFNANSAHPFENPTPFTNFFEMVLHLRHLRRAHLHARPDDRFAASTAGRSGARWRSSFSPASRPPTGPSRAATRC